MTDQALDREFSWDDEIEKDSDFILLPEGDYDFTVGTVERGRHNGSEKLPPCNSANVQLIINAPEGTVSVFHRLFLHSRTEGMISAFFAAVGLKQKGEKLKMDWNKVPGMTGRAKIGKRTYEGKEYNEVKKLYPKSDAAAAPATDGEKKYW